MLLNPGAVLLPQYTAPLFEQALPVFEALEQAPLLDRCRTLLRQLEVGDVTSVGTPKAGVFAGGSARVVAQTLVAELQGHAPPAPYDGIGACYIEFGDKRVGRVEVNFLSASKPTGNFNTPSPSLVQDKAAFATDRYARWFGR
jgi:hypothetical protein